MLLTTCAYAAANKDRLQKRHLRAFQGIDYLTAVVAMAITLIAVMMAVKCNPRNKFLYGLLAFFFSELYLIQFTLRKFIFKEKYYCPF